MTEVRYQKRESIDDIVTAERDSRPLTQQAVDQNKINLTNALAQAQEHLLTIQHNPLACDRQRKVIARYEAQLSGDWLT